MSQKTRPLRSPDGSNALVDFDAKFPQVSLILKLHPCPCEFHTEVLHQLRRKTKSGTRTVKKHTVQDSGR
jgi:hypothetical protein